MSNQLKLLIIASTFILPTLAKSQPVELEFGNWASCPYYFIPGSTEYVLCEKQARQEGNWELERAIKYEGEIQEKDTNRFNIKERYE